LFGVREVPVCLSCQAVAAGGVTVLLSGLHVNRIVANMVGLRAFVGLGGRVMYGG
jgi:hypothetical protein